MDTSNILFICGGAFVGLDKMIQRRVGKRVLGFNQQKSDEQRAVELDSSKALALAEPEDLVKYGIIPEFIGRLPVVTSLEPLSKEDLMRILVEPKNAITKQYEKLMAMENVKLEFERGCAGGHRRQGVRKKAPAPADCVPSSRESWWISCMMFPPRAMSEKCIITKKNRGRRSTRSDQARCGQVEKCKKGGLIRIRRGRCSGRAPLSPEKRGQQDS